MPEHYGAVLGPSTLEEFDAWVDGACKWLRDRADQEVERKDGEPSMAASIGREAAHRLLKAGKVKMTNGKE